jgi:hypothetical protein
MSNTVHWDTNASPPVSGNQGVPRIFRKSGGSWDREWEPRVKVSGAWKRTHKAWVKQNGVWSPVFWAPKVGEWIEYGRMQIDPYHWLKSNAQVKYLGGDPLDGASWSIQMYNSTYQEGTSSAGNADTGVQTGTAGSIVIHNRTITVSSNDDGNRTAYLYFRVGGMDYDDGGSYAASFGSFMPVCHYYSPTGDGGDHVWHRAGFDNADQLSTLVRTPSPFNYSLT